MKLYTIRDSEKAIIGFFLVTGCWTDEDFFIRNLPANQLKGKVQISILPDGISITNGLDGTGSFKIPSDELSVFKAYIESDETLTKIEHSGFSLIARIDFINERIRNESIKE